MSSRLTVSTLQGLSCSSVHRFHRHIAENRRITLVVVDLEGISGIGISSRDDLACTFRLLLRRLVVDEAAGEGSSELLALGLEGLSHGLTSGEDDVVVLELEGGEVGSEFDRTLGVHGDDLLSFDFYKKSSGVFTRDREQVTEDVSFFGFVDDDDRNTVEDVAEGFEGVGESSFSELLVASELLLLQSVEHTSGEAGKVLEVELRSWRLNANSKEARRKERLRRKREVGGRPDLHKDTFEGSGVNETNLSREQIKSRAEGSGSDVKSGNIGTVDPLLFEVLTF